jgi:hypothetical protein
MKTQRHPANPIAPPSPKDINVDSPLQAKRSSRLVVHYCGNAAGVQQLFGGRILDTDCGTSYFNNVALPVGCGDIHIYNVSLLAGCSTIHIYNVSLPVGCGAIHINDVALPVGCGAIHIYDVSLPAGCGAIHIYNVSLPVGCGDSHINDVSLDYAGMERKKQDFSLPKPYFHLIFLDKTTLVACKAPKLHKPY